MEGQQTCWSEAGGVGQSPEDSAGDSGVAVMNRGRRWFESITPHYARVAQRQSSDLNQVEDRRFDPCHARYAMIWSPGTLVSSHGMATCAALVSMTPWMIRSARRESIC